MYLIDNMSLRELFIENDSPINEHVDQTRLSETKSVVERRDVVIVPADAAICGIGQPAASHGVVVAMGRADKTSVRDIWLHRDFSKLLLISLPTRTSCVHIIDGKMPAYSESERLLVEQVGSYSRIDRIVTDGSSPTPPAAIFGAEPPHDWCYYYQKAALARQAGSWAEVGRLYDEAAARKLVPADNSEVFPFLEGLVNLGRVEDARKLYEKYVLVSKPLNFSLCSSLSSNPGYPAEFKYNYEGILQLVCGKK